MNPVLLNLPPGNSDVFLNLIEIILEWSFEGLMPTSWNYSISSVQYVSLHIVCTSLSLISVVIVVHQFVRAFLAKYEIKIFLTY